MDSKKLIPQIYILSPIRIGMLVYSSWSSFSVKSPRGLSSRVSGTVVNYEFHSQQKSYGQYIGIHSGRYRMEQ